MTDEERKNQNLIDDKIYSDYFKRFQAHTLDTSDYLILGSTPLVMSLANAPQLSLIVFQKEIENAIREKGAKHGHTQPHNISPEIIKRLPEYLRSPVAILYGNKPNTLAIVINAQNKEKKQLLVSVKLYGSVGFSTANIITTITQKNNILSYLENNKDKIIGLDFGKLGKLEKENKKANKLLRSRQVQFPKENAVISFNGSIAYTTANVKYPEENNQQKSQEKTPMNERTALLSVKKYGEEYLFNVGDKTVEDMLAVVENDNATLSDFSALGKDISLDEYAEIQQSDKFTQSVEVDLDGYEKKAEIYTVNGGNGGIAESERNDINSNITTYTYDAEINGLIWKDYGDGSMSAEYYGDTVCSVDFGTREYNIGNRGWETINTYAPDDDPADYRKETRDFVKTLPRYINEKDDKIFAEQIDRFVKGEIPHFETITLGHTSPILKVLGSKSETTTIKQNVLRNSLLPTNLAANRHSQGHNIPVDTIKQLTSALRNPVAVLSGQHSGTLVILTDLKNQDNKNIIVPISLDLRSTDNTVNKVTSIYGKDNLLNYLTRHKNDFLAIHTKKADELFTTIGYQLPQTTSVLCYDDSIAYTTVNVKYPDEKKQQKTQQEDIKMDEQNVNLEILTELKALREQVSRLEQRATDSEQKLDAISAYIAAGNEAQSFEKTMHVTEIVTQQITNCDKAQFYALDADNRFFTTDGDKREYQNADNKTNALLRSMEDKSVSINDVETAYIPVVSKDNKAIGVIVAEKSGGFEGVDFTQFGKDKAIMSQIDLAVKKELTHQEAITDKLTGLKNEKGLAEYAAANREKTVTVMEVSVPSDLPKENADDIIKAVAKTVESKGRSNINDNVYTLGGKFIVIMNCPEKKAQNIAEMLKMSIKATNIMTDVKQIKVGELHVANQKAPSSIKKVQARNVDPDTTMKNDFTKAETLEDFAKSANKYFSNLGKKVTNPKGEEKNNCYAILAHDKNGERIKVFNHENKIEVQLGRNKEGQYAGKPFALVIDKLNRDTPVRFYVNNSNDLNADAVKMLPKEIVTVISQFKEFDKPRKEQPNIDDVTSGILAEDIERYCDNGKEIEKNMVEEIKKEQDRNEAGGDVGDER